MNGRDKKALEDSQNFLGNSQGLIIFSGDVLFKRHTKKVLEKL
jgi:hypothetical protein